MKMRKCRNIIWTILWHIARQMENGEYLLSARLEIEKVNEMFDLELPESDEYMTVGGLILHDYQSFPKLNEVVT
ncbi:MAG: hypothetical protein II798_07005, partial [Lachnospiraceae bacterium]|nr:hypothetical protein [Lachnospiraceae bacterium]